MNETAIVVGATGLVGEELSKQLDEGKEFTLVKILVRRKSEKYNRVEEIIIDFEQEQQLKLLVRGGVVFCCIGTTMSKEGSKEKFRHVDYGIVLSVARAAKENGVKHFLVISSIGAKASSKNFYLQVKGQIEEELKKLNFESLSIFRPSFLLGNRKEFRFGEIILKSAMKFFQYFLIGKFRKYRPVHAKMVAKAMIKVASFNNKGITIYESDNIQELARN